MEIEGLKRVALVDHNAERRCTLAARIRAWIAVAAEGHGDLEHCVRIMRDAPYQLLVICVNGFSRPSLEALLAHLHRFHPLTAVLFALDSDMETFIAAHARLGKDDFIVGCHRQVDLIYRIAAMLACAPTRDRWRVRVGEYQIDCAGNRATVNGAEIRLTAMEAEIAHLLFSRIGEIVPRAYIAQAIWGHPERQYSRALDVHMSQLRKKLGLNDAACTLQLTGIYSKGYRLESKRESPADESSPQSAAGLLLGPFLTGLA